ncbi:hypothetical protein [Gynuella sp.]|uniref:hypothetical protein n=1 Tax=Gynuella sp. TaxID=2969146 RepID=UPI003D0D22E8
MNESGKVVSIAEYYPERALEHLNRLTGLEFSSYPESLAVDSIEPLPVDGIPVLKQVVQLGNRFRAS